MVLETETKKKEQYGRQRKNDGVERNRDNAKINSFKSLKKFGKKNREKKQKKKMKEENKTKQNNNNNNNKTIKGNDGT